MPLIEKHEVTASMKRAIALALEIFKTSPTPGRVWLKTNCIEQLEEVSDIDIAVQGCLIRELAAEYPDASFCVEEGYSMDVALDVPLCFIVDPIDGTREFVRGGSDFSISIAALSYGRVVSAVVAYPAIGRLLYAIADEGAYDSERPLSEGSMTVGSRGIRLGVSPREIALPEMQRLCKLLPGSQIVQISALTPKVGACLTGCVDVAIYLSRNGIAHVWDYAAVALIAEECGLPFTDLSGTPMLDKIPSSHASGWLISHPSLHSRLLEALEFLRS